MRFPTRVLFVSNRYKPALGGVEKHVGRVVKELSRFGVEITILTSSHKPGISRQEQERNVRIFRLPYGWDRNPPLVYLWMIANRRRFRGFHVVHIHDTLPLLLWFLPLLVMDSTTPVYVTFHGFERDPVPVIFKLLRKIAKRLVRGAICIGHFIPETYGVDCNVILTGATECVDLVEQPRNGAVFVGRLEQDTGLLGYIEAIAILEKTHDIEMPLTLCGTGGLQKEASDLAVLKGITMEQMGLVSNPQAVMNSNQVCLAAGYLSILEAMSLGLPVIGIAGSPLKAAYLKGVLEDGGPISIQTTPEGVAREIARIIKDPLLAARISERGKRFAEKMSWGRMTRAYLDLWTGGSRTPEV
ncbi:MAG: glycosyltransferase family 4 protein [Candidatus Thorarchaeota archaeon]